jgi:exodeoxyribonuclease V alpha subunit
MEFTSDLDFDDEQIKAINACLDTDSRLVAITGQAGTGKTSIKKAVYTMLVEAGYKVQCSAPTGRAARRVTELNGIPCVTNHKLLEYPQPGDTDPDTGKPLYSGDPRRNHERPLDCDVLLVDEYAMVNQEIHANLIAAIPRGRGCLRMFGDVNQLAPIEELLKDRIAPSPFQETLANKVIPSVTLKTIHRQGEGSGIIALAGQILKGVVPRQNDDARLRVTNEPVQVLQVLMSQRLDHFRTLDSQVIAPGRKYWVGTIALNQMVQRLCFPNSNDSLDYLEPERHNWDAKSPIRLHVGDKVIWTKNDYNLGLMNGDLGHITAIDFDTHEFEITLSDGRAIIVPTLVDVEWGDIRFRYNPQRNVDLGYVLTTHKSQGSEFKNVVYVLNKSSHYNQNRNNFYTAVTRASDKLMIITDQTSLSKSVRVVQKSSGT